MAALDLSQKLNQYRSAALLALEAGDRATAIEQAEAALAVISLTPDSEIQQLSKLDWDREAIAAFIDRLRRQANNATLAGRSVAQNYLGMTVMDPTHGAVESD